MISHMMATASASDPLSVDAIYQQAIAEICAENQAPIVRSPGTQVFSWTDDHGNVHFGDRPPGAVDAEVQTLQGRKVYFDLTIAFADGDPIPDVAEALNVNGHAIAEAMRQLLPADRMTKADVQINVFSRADDFRAYQRRKAPTLSSDVVGFYSVLDNSVAVWHNGRLDLTQKIALHEATHVFQTRNMGMLPGWLVEGMATYFENLTVGLQGKQVPVSDTWMQWFVRSQRYVPLQDLLTADYGQWQGPAGASYYATSWALFYFLMMPDNRVVMKSYLDIVTEQKCDETLGRDTLAFFEREYEGGVEQLQADMLRWLSSSHRVPNFH